VPDDQGVRNIVLTMGSLGAALIYTDQNTPWYVNMEVWWEGVDALHDGL
jgi:hypothetical protein